LTARIQGHEGRNAKHKGDCSAGREAETVPARFLTGNDRVGILASDDQRLVYLKGQQPFDGAMSGSLSNPDSGGPWSAVFYLTQCNSTIRGSYSIVRGSDSQKRRFSGTLSGAGISLDITAPYAYENPSGTGFCAGMTAQLTGTRDALTGTWRSSNCVQGGAIQLKR